MPVKASTINERASSVSSLGTLPGRLKGWLRTLSVFADGRAPSRPERTLEPSRDLGHEFERFVSIGDRLEQKLEELKDLQWQIRENEARYRDLLDNQADVILRRDAEGRLTFVNQAFCRVFGRERAAVLGQPFRPRVFAGDEACPLAPGAAIRHQRYVQEIETAAGPRWFEWEEHAVPASEGAVAEVQSLGRDITEARRVQAQLTDARRQAEAANRAKSRFLAAMSHEIRTPMNGILGMTGLLGETELSAEQQTYARAIDRSARTLLSLIDEILDFSKIEADKLRSEIRAAVDRGLRAGRGGAAGAQGLREGDRHRLGRRSRGAARAARRRGAVAPDRDQSGRQRHQVHGCGRRAGDRRASGRDQQAADRRRGGRRHYRGRQRHRHRSRRAAVSVPRVRAGRSCRAPPPGRDGTWACHLAPPRAGHGRRHLCCKRARQGFDVHGGLALETRQRSSDGARVRACRRWAGM